MRRPKGGLTHEVLVEEARFILRTLRREDLFGERVRLTEAERVLETSISLAFADYIGFLNKFGYVRIDQLANLIEVTEGGAVVAQDVDDAEFHARLARHFAKELSSGRARPEASPEPQVTAVIRTMRPSRGGSPERPAGPSDEVLDRRYRRGTLLGSGTLGPVYRGQHMSLGRKLAIKEARTIFQYASYLRRDEIIRRFRKIVQGHAELVHPNIVQIVDQNAEREHPYYVMEWAAGGNLRKRLSAGEDKRLELTQAIRILVQLCYALRFAHQKGALHLGLKPENVLFDELGNVKLSDFGMATMTERPESEEQASSPVLVGGGTVGYMAPELLQPGEKAVPSESADIYSLGILFYEMLTGKLPGRRSPLPSQARKEVSSTFDEVFDRMTRDELPERYTRIDEVLEGLYKAFPSKEVFNSGTILLWADDPYPLPEPEPEGPAIEEISDEVMTLDDADLKEVSTGEVSVADLTAPVEEKNGHTSNPPPVPPA